MPPLPLSHPDRKKSRMQPVKALGHFRKLIANKEDTAQVFHIVDCLKTKRAARVAEEFVMNPHGQALYQSENFLPPILDDHEMLKQLPVNSVGHAYVRFMQREGLSAAGLVAESEKFKDTVTRFDDLYEWYGDRQRDTHDLHHVLTGYGRDALGEQCVLAFNYSQNPSLGIGFIAYAGAIEIKRTLRSGAPIMRAVREGQRNGKAALKIAQQDIRALLAEPLADARKRMNIPEPTLYLRAHEMLKAGGVDPYNLLGVAA
jgi:ubiquinone biosynthesis protein COQ4